MRNAIRVLAAVALATFVWVLLFDEGVDPAPVVVGRLLVSLLLGVALPQLIGRGLTRIVGRTSVGWAPGGTAAAVTFAGIYLWFVAASIQSDGHPVCLSPGVPGMLLFGVPLHFYGVWRLRAERNPTVPDTVGAWPGGTRC